MWVNSKDADKMGRLAWAVAVPLCDKYHFHMGWLIVELDGVLIKFVSLYFMV